MAVVKEIKASLNVDDSVSRFGFTIVAEVHDPSCSGQEVGVWYAHGREIARRSQGSLE